MEGKQAIGQVESLATVGLYTSRVYGTGTANTTVTADLLDATGAMRDTQSASIDASGNWQLWFGDASALLTIRPDDAVRIDFHSGDPILLKAPTLTAVADPDHEIVTGQAPPLSQLAIRVLRSSIDCQFACASVVASTTIQSDASGRYVADIGSLRDGGGKIIDLEPPLQGDVSLLRDDGHRFVIGWAPLSFYVQIGENRLFGSGAPWRSGKLTVSDASGTDVASADIAAPTTTDVGAYTNEWEVEPVDATGRPVRVIAGDVLQMHVGDDEASLRVPIFDAAVHLAQRRLIGTAPPNTIVQLQANTPEGDSLTADVAATADGRIDYRFPATFALSARTDVWLGLTVGRNTFTRSTQVPGLLLDLTSGVLSGWTDPLLETRVDVEREGRRIAQTRFVGTDTGEFQMQLVAADRAPLRPLVQDRLTVTIPGRESDDKAFGFAVPDFTLDFDAPSRLIRGYGLPGTTVDIVSSPIFGPLGSPAFGEKGLLVDANGRWQGTHGASPGHYVMATLAMPSGHLVRRSAVSPVPLVNAQFGGPLVCGFGAAGARVDAQLRVGTSILGSASGQVDDSGAFRLMLLDADGAAVHAASEAQLQVRVGDATTDIAMPPFDVAIDWAGRTARGHMSADTTLHVADPAQGCARVIQPIRGLSPVIKSDTNGGFMFKLTNLSVLATRGSDVVLTTSDGHRLFWSLWADRFDVYVGSPIVRGHSTANSDVAARLIGPSSQVRGTASTVVGAETDFISRMHAADDRPINIEAGDTVELTTDQGITRIPVAPLSFDFSRNGGLEVETSPRRAVRVMLTFSNSVAIAHTLDFTLQADAAGHAALAAEPARGGWKWADVSAIELRVDADMDGDGKGDGVHDIVAGVDLDDAAAPAGGAKMLWLPFVRR